MKHSVLFLLCSIAFLPWDVACFEFVRDFLFPRTPMVIKVRNVEDARALADEFAVLDTVGLVEQHGYPAEEHNVTTVDGYKITFFRIPGSPISPRKEGKPTIFLQHGLFASSDVWVLFGPEKDLAFLLADAGYDVWIGNVRGNTYGRSHTDLSPQDRQFWSFSFHEIAMRDLPAMFDYIFERTGTKNLFYVGHSMGTTVIFILLSELPEYNEKIRLAVNFAPIALWKQLPSLLTYRLAIETRHLIVKIFEEGRIYEIFPQTRNNGRLARALCSDNSLTQPACGIIYSLLAGDDPEQLNSTLIPYMAGYFPAGGSTATLRHFQQNMVTGIFQQFDFGFIENFRLYGKKKPPIYDVKKISAPMALFCGKNDPLSLETNVMELARRLQRVVAVEVIPYNAFNHIDFLWAKDIKRLLYDRIIELISLS